MQLIYNIFSLLSFQISLKQQKTKYSLNLLSSRIINSRNAKFHEISNLINFPFCAHKPTYYCNHAKFYYQTTDQQKTRLLQLVKLIPHSVHIHMTFAYGKTIAEWELYGMCVHKCEWTPQFNQSAILFAYSYSYITGREPS